MEINPASGAQFGISETATPGVRDRSSAGARDVADSTSCKTLKSLTEKLEGMSEVRDDVVEGARRKLASGELDTPDAALGAADKLLEEGI